jgi:Protein of unknown function (DUF3631)
MTSTAIARSPQQIRREIATRPEMRAQLQLVTGELLDGIAAFIERYVSMPPEEITTCALYVAHTWTLDACDATPYLLVLSAEKGSGKTRLLEVLGYLVRNPWHTNSATPTVLFRRMDQDQPTLMLDEIDTVFRGGASHEALRAVLNAGNRRGSTVTRCDGRWGTKEYQTFGAKVLCGIDTGFVPDTILDRSIVIRMRRSAAGEVDRFRPRAARMEVEPVTNTLAAWALIAAGEVAQLEPEIPHGLSDRAADGWEPLLAISDFAGPGWGGRARGAVAALSGACEEPPAPFLAGMDGLFRLPAAMAEMLTTTEGE